MSPATRRALRIYLAAVGAVFLGLGALVAWHREALVAGLLGFVLPDAWVGTAEVMVEGFLERHRAAALNALATVIAGVVPALTFPFKERLSGSFEADRLARRPGAPAPPPPPALWRQALDEALLLAVFLALLLAALRITVTPGLGRLGAWLMWAVLTFTFAVDYVGPTLLRHHARPTAIYRALFAGFPLRSMGFGALMALPLLGAARALPLLPPVLGFALLAVVNLAVFGGAVLLGTALAEPMLPRAKALGRSPAELGLWLAVLVSLGLNGAFFGGAARAAYGVTPVLKCDWRPVPGSFEWSPPSLGDPGLRLALEVDVHNPTDRLARIGDNTVTLLHRGIAVTRTRLPPFEVGPGATRRQAIVLAVRPRLGLLGKAVAFGLEAAEDGVWTATRRSAEGAVDPKAWRVELRVPLDTGDLVLPLYSGDPGG